MWALFFSLFSFFGYSIQYSSSLTQDWTCAPCRGSRVWTTGLPRKSQDIGFGIGQIWILFYLQHCALWYLVDCYLPEKWQQLSFFLIIILCDRACNAEYRACYSCTHTFIIKCVLPIRSWCRRKPCIFFPSL